MNFPTTKDLHSFGVTFAGIFGLLIACVLMTTKDLASVTTVSTLAIVGAISLAAACGDLVIRYQRHKKGITEDMLIRQAHADIASGKSAFSPNGPRWPIIVVSVAASAIIAIAGLYFSNLPT
jgi:hypothetical protein